MTNASRNKDAWTGSDIRSISSTCLKLLESCFYKTRDAELEAKVEASERRFRSWTNKARVFGRNGRCLDTQLRSDKEKYIREMFLALLNVLRENLSALELAVNKNPETPIAKVDHLLYGIDGSLQRLAKIAHGLLVSIQASLTRHIVSFAKRRSLQHGIDDYSSLDDIGHVVCYVSEVVHERFQPLRLHEPRELADARRQFQSTMLLPSSTMILPIMATREKATREKVTEQDAKEKNVTEKKVTGDEERKKYWHSMASIVKTMLGLSDDEAKSEHQLRSQGLFTAIVRSCVFRHYRILYEREKKVQEPEVRKEQPVTAVETSPDHLTTPDVEEDQGHTPTDLEIGAPSQQTQEVHSSGPPTVDHVHYRDVVDAEGSSYIETDTETPPMAPSEAGAGYYPRAPRVDGAKCAECPICKQVIQATELQGDRWRRHVDKDILPFACVLDGCMSELQLFPSRESWARHMHTAHTTSWLESLHNGYEWSCSICHTSATSTSSSRADVEDDFIKHIENNHVDVLSDARLLATVSCFPLSQPKDTCPICAKTRSASAVRDLKNKHPTAPTAAETALDSASKILRWAEDTVEQPSRHPDLSRVEKCVARHLKGLALYFLNAFLDETVPEANGPPSHVVDAGVSPSDQTDSESEDSVQDVQGLRDDLSDTNVPDVPASPKASTSGGRDPAPGKLLPLIKETGLYVSKKPIEPNARRSFLEVQPKIEKMLLEFMRKLKSGPGRYRPIAIRPMMLAKTEDDADAKPYIVVICPEEIKGKLQDFFDEPWVKSLSEPGDSDLPSFKTLLIGHASRLR